MMERWCRDSCVRRHCVQTIKVLVMEPYRRNVDYDLGSFIHRAQTTWQPFHQNGPFMTYLHICFFDRTLIFVPFLRHVHHVLRDASIRNFLAKLPCCHLDATPWLGWVKKLLPRHYPRHAHTLQSQLAHFFVPIFFDQAKKLNDFPPLNALTA